MIIFHELQITIHIYMYCIISVKGMEMDKWNLIQLLINILILFLFLERVLILDFHFMYSACLLSIGCKNIFTYTVSQSMKKLKWVVYFVGVRFFIRFAGLFYMYSCNSCFELWSLTVTGWMNSFIIHIMQKNIISL